MSCNDLENKLEAIKKLIGKIDLTRCSPANAMGVPVDYVWRNGRSLCHECNKKEAKGE